MTNVGIYTGKFVFLHKLIHLSLRKVRVKDYKVKGLTLNLKKILMQLHYGTRLLPMRGNRQSRVSFSGIPFAEKVYRTAIQTLDLKRFPQILAGKFHSALMTVADCLQSTFTLLSGIRLQKMRTLILINLRKL